ncbi:hypothetical protein Lfu02_31530 [Longispora fulva]|nr:hypothetical protein Lfu02_31530 [Longispora fulva]
MGDENSQVAVLIEVRAKLASADEPGWEAQRRLMRQSSANYDARTQTWTRLIGNFDDNAIAALGCFGRAADEHATGVTMRLVVAPEGWTGPVLRIEQE